MIQIIIGELFIYSKKLFIKIYQIKFLVALMWIIFSSSIFAQSQKYPVRKNAPVGTALKGNQLVAQKGYRFEYKVKGDNSIVVLLDNNGVTKGEMSCECSKGSGSGSCDMATNGQDLQCLKNECTSCIMVLSDLSNKVKYTLLKRQ